MRMARRRAHISWAANVVAPWCLAAGALVSFTADAGQEVPSGASRAPLSTLAAVMPKDLVPSPHVLTSSFGGAFGRGMLHEARLVLGAAEQITAPPDEVEPRADLKKNVKIFPEIDRRHKGDPLVGLRPTIDGALRQEGGQKASLAQMRANFLTFGQDEIGLASRFEIPATGPDDGAPALRPTLPEHISEGARRAFRAPSRSAPARPMPPTRRRSGF